jgi:hypothetical protein
MRWKSVIHPVGLREWLLMKDEEIIGHFYKAGGGWLFYPGDDFMDSFNAARTDGCWMTPTGSSTTRTSGG